MPKPPAQTIVAPLACLLLPAGCATGVTVAAPSFGAAIEAREKQDERTREVSWWETYGDEPRSP